MKFSISINDTWTGQPVADAKIFLRSGEVEQSAKSDRDGKFFREDDREYVGAHLICRVQKEGYELWETSTQVERDEIHLDVELMPETIELVFNVLDLAGKPLKGAQVSVSAFGQELAKAIADHNGSVKVLVSDRFTGKTLKYRAEREGFVSSSDEFQAKVNVVSIISLQKMERSPKPFWKWWKKLIGTLIIFAVLTLINDYFSKHKGLLWGIDLEYILIVLIILFGVGVFGGWRNRRSTKARSEAKIGK